MGALEIAALCHWTNDTDWIERMDKSNPSL